MAQVTNKPLKMIAGPFVLVSTAAFSRRREAFDLRGLLAVTSRRGRRPSGVAREGMMVMAGTRACVVRLHARQAQKAIRMRGPQGDHADAQVAVVRERAAPLPAHGRAAAMNRLLQPFDRLLAALTDPARRERTMVLTLIVYCAIWSLYGVLAKGSRDLHFDMGEMFAWSREAGIGTPKHPPFAAWVVRVWFVLFPQADWAFYLLAMVLATFALWAAWRASEPYLDGEKRVVALALLTFIPFFNFHALKYNANTILVPLWAVTTWLLPARVRDAQSRLGVAGWRCRRRRDAGEILVDLPARGARDRGARRLAPRGVLPFARAVAHHRGGCDCVRAASRVDRVERLCALRLRGRRASGDARKRGLLGARLPDRCRRLYRGPRGAGRARGAAGPCGVARHALARNAGAAAGAARVRAAVRACRSLSLSP